MQNGLNYSRKRSLGNVPESGLEIIPVGEYWIVLHGGRQFSPETFKLELLDDNWRMRNDPIVVGLQSLLPWTTPSTIEGLLGFINGDKGLIVEALFWDSDGGPVSLLVPTKEKGKDSMTSRTLQVLINCAQDCLERGER